jgi:phospholipid/cholesterol/gamma-HCH transport system substrate-binding protein
MTFSKEARIGLMVAISIIVLFAGFYFLKGSDILSKELSYYAYYDNVQGLQPSAGVQIKGLQVGKVSNIELNGGGKVKVTIAIHKKTRLPQGTVAKLTSTDLLGTKGITLDLGAGTAMIEDESVLPGDVEGGVIDKISVEVTPLLQDVRKVVNSVDSVLNSVNEIFNAKARADLQNSVASLNTAMTHFSNVSSTLDRQSNGLARTIQNADKITSNLASNNANIDATLKNLRSTSNQLSQAPVEQTVKNLQAVSVQLNDVMRKINNSEGSIGMAVNDKKLYSDLSGSLQSLQSLLADLQAHPSRYINVTIFGKKRQVGE